MKFPYGLSDFARLIREGYLYVDRTQYIRTMEEMGPTLLFLRPRRFGKSLWLSTLANYYDVLTADRFEALFGHLTIGQEPTPLHNRYLILRWNFSAVNAQGDAKAITSSLYGHINGCIEQFVARYGELLDYPIVIDEDNALRSFQSVLAATQRSPYRLYLLIDEYDNFANEVLTASEDRYYDLVSGEGVLRTIFKAVKDGTGGLGLERIFITGVSPVVMSDVTSGFNIAKNIYLHPRLNALCGFTEAEVEAILRQVVDECGYPAEEAEAALAMMRTFYNGYRFHGSAPEAIYNPTLVFYFLDVFQDRCRYPRDMLDANLATDRAKLAYAARLPHGGQVILDALSESRPLLVDRISDRFGVEDMLTVGEDSSLIASLLYYLGVLTLDGVAPTGELVLRIPNLVVRGLYAEQMRTMLLPTRGLHEVGRRAARELYAFGRMEPLCEFVESKYFPVFSNRDYRWANELTVKTAFLSLLFNDILYIMDSEPELERGYADLVMIIRPDMRRFEILDVLIEFKYVALGEAGLSGEQLREADRAALRALPPVEEKLAEARLQLKRHRRRLEARYGDALRLRTYAVVSLGFERLVWEEIP